MTVHITAERPETLDLMRRNIDQLAQSLAESGRPADGFTFGDGGEAGRGDGADGGDDQPDGSARSSDETSAPAPVAEADMTEDAGSGVDIRI